jgi:hypothetical protein
VIISEAFTSSVLELKVYAHRTYLADVYVGDMKETIGILAGAEGGGTPSPSINRIFVDSSVLVVRRVLVVKDTKRPLQASVEFIINYSPVIQLGEPIESRIEAARVARESHSLPPGFSHGDDTTTATDNRMAEGVEQATNALVRMDNAPSALGRSEGAVSDLNTVVNEISSRVGPWQPLLEKLQLFKDVVDKIAEVCHLARYI